jgi:hypothetical protein
VKFPPDGPQSASFSDTLVLDSSREEEVPAVKRVLVILAVAAAAVSVAAPLSNATTSPGYNFKIHVTVTDSGVLLDRSVAKRGWLAHFVVTNKGKKTHVFDVGGLKTKPLKPGATGKVGAYLDDRGQYPIKVDQKKRGFFTVQ